MLKDKEPRHAFVKTPEIKIRACHFVVLQNFGLNSNIILS